MSLDYTNLINVYAFDERRFAQRAPHCRGSLRFTRGGISSLIFVVVLKKMAVMATVILKVCRKTEVDGTH